MAYTPTIEGLFRSSNNKDFTANTIETFFLVRSDKNFEDDLQPQQVKDKVESEGRWNDSYVQLMFFVESDNKAKMLQLVFDDSSMSMDHLREVKMISNIFSYLQAEDNNLSIQQRLFFSTLLSQMFGHSRSILSLLKSLNIDIQRNNELENVEKVRLLHRYKIYLQALKDEPSIKNSISSPLNPENEADKEKIAQTLKKPYYVTPEYIKLVKDKDNFYWDIILENFQARFDNSDHNLKNMSIRSGEQTYSLELSNYTLFNGYQTLPKYFTLQNQSSTIIQTLAIKQRQLRPNSFADLFQEFKNTIMENTSKNSKSGQSAKQFFKNEIIL